jgi:ribosomal protein S18 acetylase RimI-like enzyme
MTARTDFRIRKATLSDVPEIGVLHVASWRATYTGIIHESYLQDLSVSERSEAARLRIERGTTDVMVAEVEGKVVGFADVGVSRNPEIAESQIYAIYLLPEYFGIGAGKALFQKTLQIAREKSYRSLFVSVLSQNLRAVEFYVKQGGKLIGHDCVILDDIRYETDTYVWNFEVGP